MAMLMRRIKTILIPFAAAAVNFAAIADSNDVVAVAKCPQATSANVGVLVSDAAVSRELKAEMKEAVAAAEVAYEKRYEELKDAHGRFMLQLNISLGIIAALVTIFGAVLPMLMQWRTIDGINRKEGEIDKRIDDGVRECGNVASRVEESAKEEVSKVLQMVWKTQVISTHQALESTLSACKYAKWAYSRVCYRDMIQEILSVLKWLSYVTDKSFVVDHFKKLDSELQMFRDNTVNMSEWQCKEENMQTSDVRINLEWCAEEYADEFKRVQSVLNSLGLKVLDS